jgi:alpha-methylacyl-CoA racemase
MGAWGPRGTNLLDGGSHWYGVYETSDGEWISIASFEPQFYVELIDVLGLDDVDPAMQMDSSQWPALKERIAGIIRTRTRDEWVEVMRGRDVCFAPVLTMREARAHAHNRARRTFVEVAGVEQPAPAPRFDRTAPNAPRRPLPSGHDSRAALEDWGLGAAEIEELRREGVIS